MQLLENINEIGNKLGNLEFGKIQENFLQTTLGKVIDGAIDQGLKYVMPDFIEDEVIEIKNTLLSEGLKEAIDKTIEKSVDLGKTAIGIFTGNFENVSQAENAVKEGGIIDGISDAIDSILKKLVKEKIIPTSVGKLIKSGKKEIINNIEKNIKNEFVSENKSLNNLEKNIDKWNNYYSEKNLSGLNKEYKKILKEEKNILPIINIVNNINKIKNIHELINNSDNFDFDNIYLDLSESFK